MSRLARMSGGLLFLGILAAPAWVSALAAGTQETNRELGVLHGRIDALERLIEAAEAKGIDASAAKVTLTVGRLFAGFIPGDAGRKVEDYPRDMIDFRILGRDEALKRIQGLAAFEARETVRLLDRDIENTRRLLADPALNLKIPPGDAGQIAIGKGAFSSGGKPVFISGIYGLPFRGGGQQRLDMAKRLGANLLGPIPVSHAASRGWNQFDESSFEKQVYPVYRAAEKKGLLVNPAMWNYRAPGWLAKEAPDINLADGKGWFRDCMDLDHPLTERFNRAWFAYAASRLKRLPNNFCYSLMGEEWCSPEFRGGYTPQRYENWLREKHKTIEGLNRAWGTTYRDFAEAAGKQSLQTKGGYYDWHAFNEHRLTSFNQSQIDGIRQSDPEGLWTCWPAAGCLVSAPLGGFDPHYGRNREDILRQSSVSGWDGGIFAVEAGPSTRRLPESHWAKYSLGWRDEMIYYDFAKSVCPDKPVFDPELHTITSVYHISPLGVSGDYFRTTLWMEHLHGLGAHLLWWWGRNEDGAPRYGEFLGGLLTQPQLLDSWGRTVLELRRLTEHVVLFPQLERRVRILYCEPSAIHDPKLYPLAVRDAYEALYFLDYPVGFVTERMIREGKLAECSLLVVPGGKHASDETVAALREYRRKGGRVAVLGQEPLKCDEYGKERGVPDFLSGLALSGSTPEEYWPQLDKMLDEVGIERPVRLAGKDGKRLWGVELRVARKGDRRVLSLINLNRQPVEIVLKPKGSIGQFRDLVTDRSISLDSPMVLEPRKPMLLELSSKPAGVDRAPPHRPS